MFHRAWIALVVLLSPVAALAGVFDVGGKPPERIVVTMGDVPPASFQPLSPMLDQLRGVAAVLDASDIKELRLASLGPTTKVVEMPADATRVLTAYCTLADQTRAVDIYRDEHGAFLAREAGAAAKIKATRLDSRRFSTLSDSWHIFQGGYKRPEAIRAGEIVDMPTPIMPAWWNVDADLLSKRFNAERTSQVPPAVRVPAQEAYRLRLPRRYDGKLAAGVIIWVDASPGADLPASLKDVCDELQIIVAGPRNAPNNRPVADRYQLALDALTNARTRFVIDPSRVYVAGLSGGGQISTHLWACMPDVFTGAIPCAALASYKNVVVAEGSMWQGTIGKPVPALMKQIGTHRCAAVTGSEDFNHKVVLEVAKLWQADGLAVRVFDFPGLRHAVPAPEQIAEAVRWVDEPATTARDAAWKDAQAAVDALKTQPDSPEKREKLAAITRSAPWSPAAWEAAEILGVALPAP